MAETPDSLREPSSVTRPREWHRASASEMRAALDAGEISSLELCVAHLERIAEVDREISAFTEVFHDSAKTNAARLDEERAAGKLRGPLHGVPVTIKECFDFEGRPTTLGVQSRRTARATSDSAMVRALSDAGAVLLGRTNVAQLLLAFESDNPVFGRTANPFSPRHSAGGSSGGEAAAIAAGLSPLGVGTDLGGSARVPAHFCGVAALLPTPYRLPNSGCQGPLPGQRTIALQTSLLARRVADLELCLDALPATALARLDPGVPPTLDLPAAALRGLSVGVLKDNGLLAPSSALIGALERATDALRAAGVSVTPFSPPALDELFFDAVALLSAEGGHALLAALGGGQVAESLRSLHKLVRVPRPVRAGLEKVAQLSGDKEMARLIACIGETSVGEYQALGERLAALRVAMLDAWQSAGVDAVLTPPFATPAVPHGLSADFLVAASYSMPWNAVGFVAGVVPVTRVHGAEARRDRAKGQLGRLARRIDEQSAGLPVGVQLVAPPWRERTALALMKAIETNVCADVDYPRTPVW